MGRTPTINSTATCCFDQLNPPSDELRAADSAVVLESASQVWLPVVGSSCIYADLARRAAGVLHGASLRNDGAGERGRSTSAQAGIATKGSHERRCIRTTPCVACCLCGLISSSATVWRN